MNEPTRAGQWDSAEVARLADAGPSENVAFVPVSITPVRLAETLVALANTHGGVVLLGLTARGKLQDAVDPADSQAKVRAACMLASPPLLLSAPVLAEAHGRTVCIAEVPPGLPHVYSIDGRHLTRTGARNRLLSGSELAALLLARSESGFEARPVPQAVLADLDMAQVEGYLSALDRTLTEAWPVDLLARNLLTGGSDRPIPTYAGILLLGSRPQRFLPNAQISLVRYASPTMADEFLRQDATGTLPEQIRLAEAFVSANTRRGVRLTGFARQDVPEYPMPVVREAIVNAVAHRDYAIRGDNVRVLMFSDRLEVYSPGRLPGHVTLDNLVSERFSRNEAIVQALSDLGFVERLGYGIDRMLAAMADAGLDAPAFEETTAGFRVILRGRGDDLVSGEQSARWHNPRVNPRQERALAYLMEHGSIANREFRELCPDLSDETIRRELADMVDSGLIVKVGDRKATYYILR